MAAREGWHFFATTLDRAGGETLLVPDLPLSGAQVVTTMSGPGGLDGGSIPVEVARLRGGNGLPLFRPWSTCVYAELDGVIRGGGVIADDVDIEDGPVSLPCKGFSSYPTGMAYNTEKNYVQADPFTIAREFWSDLQARSRSNIGLQVVCSPETTPVRLGTEAKDVSFETGSGDAVDFEAGPYKINYFDTLDMGSWWDSLAKDGGFDYYETHAWADGTNPDPRVGDPVDIVHTLHLGYPTVGRDLRSSATHRFEIGVNVTAVPTLSLSADDYCDWVLVIGAGEGRSAVRGTAAVPDQGRLHRTKVVQDQTIKSKAVAMKRAAQIASAYAGDQNITELKVRNHPYAPLGSYGVGDTIQVFGSGKGWAADLDLSLRITEIAAGPDDGDTATLKVARPDKVSSEV